MSELIHQPLLPAQPAGEPFTQTITLREGQTTLGTAVWNCSGSTDGVVQLVSLFVASPMRRHGHATRLLDAIIREARDYMKRRGLKLRQVWYGVEQKSQVNGRAFLMHNNFHHVGTIQDLLKGQDLLIYKKSLV
jgi:GNAT superfamily N-acetyltransferase